MSGPLPQPWLFAQLFRLLMNVLSMVLREKLVLGWHKKLPDASRTPNCVAGLGHLWYMGDGVAAAARALAPHLPGALALWRHSLSCAPSTLAATTSPINTSTQTPAAHRAEALQLANIFISILISDENKPQ